MLTKDQTKKVIKWIKDKQHPDAKCDMCHHLDWRITPHFVTPITINYDAKYIALELQAEKIHTNPCVFLYCDNCGNTKLLSATVMNIWKKPKC